MRGPVYMPADLLSVGLILLSPFCLMLATSFPLTSWSCAWLSSPRGCKPRETWTRPRASSEWKTPTAALCLPVAHVPGSLVLLLLGFYVSAFLNGYSGGRKGRPGRF